MSEVQPRMHINRSFSDIRCPCYRTTAEETAKQLPDSEDKYMRYFKCSGAGCENVGLVAKNRRYLEKPPTVSTTDRFATCPQDGGNIYID